ncbi:MAG: methylmalonyl-CoA epimerase [Pseudomonadota bacterium]|jgi:methylmalonyl-CoA epimerase
MVIPQTWSVDHIGIAVSDLTKAIDLYATTAGATVTLRETLESQGVELAFLNTGGCKVELLAALRHDTALGKFLSTRGPGLHHICYKVDNIRAELERLAAHGYELIDSIPRAGAGGSQIAFISPKSCLGVLTELCEYSRT